MRGLLIGVLLTCFFSIGASCGEESSGARSVSSTRDESAVNAVPEPSSLLLGATGALLIGFALRRSHR